MNLYFILEGEKTEMILYPKWINFILPHFIHAPLISNVNNNSYYLFSGAGIPSIYNHTVNAIKDINDNPIFNRLIVCLDGEEIGVEERINELKNYIQASGVSLVESCQLDIVIQNICIETWFLGNRKVVKKIPEGQLLREFINHFNVTSEDPEIMDKMDSFRNKAHFHYAYFREILKEHNLVYRKSQPKIVMDKAYFEELEKRVNETEHLSSFKSFITLLYEISALTK